MAWGSTPTTAGQITFAKGRLKRFAARMEKGAEYLYTPTLEEIANGMGAMEVSDAEGLTAHMKNGARIFAYRTSRLLAYRSVVRYAVVKADGKVAGWTWSVGNAIALALGGRRKFAFGHSEVNVKLCHEHKRNKLKVEVVVTVPNLERKYTYDSTTKTPLITTTKQNVVDLAVGVLADPDGYSVMPLLDCLQETYGHREDFAKACGNLWAEPVPAETILRIEAKWCETKRGHIKRTVYDKTGLPVEGPDGEWKPW